MNSAEILKLYKTKNWQYWQQLQQQHSLALFKDASRNVPAYADFLKINKVNPVKIKTYKDFLQLPHVEKANYFREYPFAQLMRKGELQKKPLIMTASSGSTGKQTYFSRSPQVDWQYSVLAEYFLNNAPKGKTLFVDCFSMGIWIGGMISYQAFYDAAQRGYSVTLITPGINKKEIFNGLKELKDNYDRIILAGYPPFIKDVVDELKAQKIKFRKNQLRFLFAAEGFTEGFRDYVCGQFGTANVYKDTLNIYGSAELGAMAFETPLAILIRRLAVKKPALHKALFGRGDKLPTLVQYNPMFAGFESKDGHVFITGNSSMPFVRYRIGDNGGAYNFNEVREILSKHGFDLRKEARKAKLEITELPFAFVFERSDFSATLYGLQVYPQTIKRALEHRKLQQALSGKFTMATAYDKKGQQYLELHLEMKPKVKAGAQLEKIVGDLIVKSLLENNPEYRELSKMISDSRTRPKLHFWGYNHETYFKSGVKQQWLKK